MYRGKKKQAVIDEYDAIFTKKREKWTSDWRPQLAYDTIAPFLPNPKNVIDVGCGNGHIVEYLAKKFPEANFTGIDPSPVAIQIAESRRIPKAKFTSMFLDEFKTWDEPFDLVLLVGVIEHFEKPEKQLPILRALTDGFLYIEAPNCIAYPETRKEEGYFRLPIGSKQMEWHLYRETWENMFKEHFEIVYSGNGPTLSTDFVWLLK